MIARSVSQHSTATDIRVGRKYKTEPRLGKVLHVWRFYVDDGEALICDVQVPQVHPQVICTDECLLQMQSSR